MVLTVRYAVPGMGDLDDEIIILTEGESYRIPVLARRTPPEVRMESPIVAAPCWLGVRSERVIKCTNIGGETGFNLLPGKEIDQKQENPEFLKLGPFSIYPPEFYLQKGDSINLVVLYAPDSPGEHMQDLILETAFQTRTTYQLKGTGCILDLEATALDAMVLNFKENPLSVIYFNVTKPKSVATRKLKVRNNSSMKVQYHWSIYKNKVVEKISLAGEETHYAIEPLQGAFNGHEEQEFTISFKPIHAESYFEYADLIVDDIPIQAVPDAPESLKALLTPAAAGPTYLGSNTRYPSFPYLKFTLQGYGDSCEIIPDPPILAMPGDMLISKPYTGKVRLFNKSKAEAKTRFWMKGKSSEGFDVKVSSAKMVMKDNIYSGVLTDEVEEIELTIQSKSTGTHRAYFVGEIEDGNPFTFELFGHFTGPRVRLIEKAIDFGLVRTKTSYEFRLNLENTTEIDAEVLIKNAKNKSLTFDSAGNDSNAQSQIDLKSKKSGGPTTKFGAIPSKGSQSSSSLASSISIEPEHVKLGPLDKSSVLITLRTAHPETIEEYLEILTRRHGSQFISLHAEVQKPHLSLNRAVIDLGVTYAGLQYKIDSKHKGFVTIRNHGNLDAQFQVLK